jgi:hypothetical protein
MAQKTGSQREKKTKREKVKIDKPAVMAQGARGVETICTKKVRKAWASSNMFPLHTVL